jgi:uncharacterized lipoprotein NlpE involved in copper resistance
MRKTIITISVSTLMLLGCLGQQQGQGGNPTSLISTRNVSPAMIGNLTGPNQNKQDFAYAGAPLITGDYCKYMWHEEFNTLFVTCHDGDGLISGNQLRTVQNPLKQCSVVNDVYMPVLSVSELA